MHFLSHALRYKIKCLLRQAERKTSEQISDYISNAGHLRSVREILRAHSLSSWFKATAYFKRRLHDADASCSSSAQIVVAVRTLHLGCSKNSMAVVMSDETPSGWPSCSEVAG